MGIGRRRANPGSGEEEAPRRRYPAWLTILALTSCGFVMALQNTLPVPLLTDLTGILGVTVTDVSSLLTIMVLTGALATPVMGKLADMYGKRRLLLIGLAIGLLGDVIALFSDSYPPILVSRGLAGVTVAIIPIAISVMRDEVPRERLGISIGLMSVTLGAGAALALPLGGLLAGAFDWHSIFVLSGAVAAGALLLTAIVVRESPVRTGGRFDLLGSLLLTVSLAALLLGMSKIVEWGWLGLPTIACAVVALATGLLWLLAETRASQPVVDIGVSLSRPVLLTNVATLLIGVAMFFNFITTSQQVQLPAALGGFGLDAFQAGLVMLPSGLVILVAAPIGGILMQRFGGRFALILGGAVIAASYAFRAVFDQSIPEIIIGSVLVQAGVAVMFGATPAIVMEHVPITETASANGVNALVRSIGNALASAVAAAVFGAIAVSDGVASYPSELAIDIAFVVGAAAALLGTLAAIGIPRGSAEADAGLTPTGDEGAPATAAPRPLDPEAEAA